jgi:SAM-dependent MidA family methyltransferase
MSDGPDQPHSSPGGPQHPVPVDRILAERIRARGPVSFGEFMETALYHPGSGYYRRPRERVGTGDRTDFYTAYTAGDVFADLVAEAAGRLAQRTGMSGLTLVEIGAEPGHSLWEAPPPPFPERRILAYGDPLDLPTRAAVFSNELFDAQPFHRVRFRGGAWTEAGVDLDGDALRETVLAEVTPAVRPWLPRLPSRAPENAVIDLPLGAVALLEKIVAPPWQGIFLAFDYGKRWSELCAEHPEGTLRGYRRHRPVADILENPGEQDLTGHICWDWMTETLERRGFAEIRLESQEAFLVKNASGAVERIIRRRPGLPDPARNRLHQLIHPGHMGQKFQVLSARRG